MNYYKILLLLLLLTPVQSTSQTYIDGYKSGRYTIKKNSAERSLASEVKETSPDEVIIKTKVGSGSESNSQKSSGTKNTGKPKSEDKVVTSTVVPVEAEVSTAAKSSSDVTETSKIANQAQSSNTNSQKDDSVQSQSEPTIKEQLSILFSSNPKLVAEFYNEHVSSDDIRRNKFELDFEMGYTYNSSQSSYGYRKYDTSYNYLAFKPSIWLTPGFGLNFKHSFSLAGDIASPTGTSRSIAKFEQLLVGLSFRNFINLSKSSPYLEYLVQYYESKLSIPSTDLFRNKLKSAGVGFGIKAKIPQTDNFKYSLGAIIYPRASHKEEETSIVINSGNNSNNIITQIEVLGEYKIERENLIYFGIQLDTEKNYFDGTAGLSDPLSGQSQTNVSVTNSFTQLVLGYRWAR